MSDRNHTPSDIRVQHHVLLCIERGLVFALQQPFQLPNARLHPNIEVKRGRCSDCFQHSRTGCLQPCGSNPLLAPLSASRSYCFDPVTNLARSLCTTAAAKADQRSPLPCCTPQVDQALTRSGSGYASQLSTSKFASCCSVVWTPGPNNAAPIPDCVSKSSCASSPVKQQANYANLTMCHIS